tara:strand:+ start:69 stop:662 length:594 start_codon:yes stop_codon:yes gene_type:complete
MKKLSLYIFLVVMFCSVSFANDQAKKLIENCTDQTYIGRYDYSEESHEARKRIINYHIETDPYVKSYESMVAFYELELVRERKLLKAFKKKYLDYSKNTLYGQIRRPEGLSEDESVEWVNKKANEYVSFINAINKLRREKVENEALLHEAKYLSGLGEFKKMSLEDKIKDNEYYSFFSQCESAYKKNPIAFKTRYKK